MIDNCKSKTEFGMASPDFAVLLSLGAVLLSLGFVATSLRCNPSLMSELRSLLSIERNALNRPQHDLAIQRGGDAADGAL